MKARIALFLFASLIPVSRLAAQNSSAAVEPFYPQLCSTVDAQLQTRGNTIAPEDEQKTDTVRIQRAIDKCGKGRAVRLRVNEVKNAFLSGPLILKDQVTLILDRGVTLFASREAALFDSRMGSCGNVNDVTARCRPLITVQKADDAGVMGDGVIDGRGGDKMLNSQFTWWQLAGQPNSGGYARLPRLISVENSDRFTLYRITLKNAPAETVYFDHGDGLTMYGVTIEAPQGSASPKSVFIGEGAKNISIARTEGAGPISR